MGKGGKSIPGVLEVAEDMSKTIKSQLSGETSSTKQNSGDESSSGIKGSEKFDEDMSGMPEPPEEWMVKCHQEWVIWIREI